MDPVASSVLRDATGWGSQHEMEMEMFTIEKGIPVPKNRKGVKRGYPFESLGVGDSFLVTDRKITTMSSACQQKSKGMGKKYIARTVPGGVRVWRIE